jgi:DNA-directed RNA polymerase specialized sigma24 family protein
MTSEELKVKLEALHTLSFAWALRCCGEHAADAQDVLQNTYVKTLAGKARFKQQFSHDPGLSYDPKL